MTVEQPMGADVQPDPIDAQPAAGPDARIGDARIGDARVRAVEVRLVRMPLPVVTAFATRRVTSRDYVLVRIVSTDGTEGLGLTYAGSQAGSVVLEAAEALLAPVIVGHPTLMVEGLWEKMYREALLQGRSGAVMRALSAIDIAVWDLNARAAGLPLWQYLGAHSSGSLTCYASGGYYHEGKTPEDLAAEMGSYADLGFGAMKMKVGLQDLATERRRIALVRERIGPDVRLFLDANNAWPDLFSALPFVRAFEPLRPDWLEEPFSPDDIESHARLVAATTIPVATGEVEAGRWRFREILAARAAHVLQADALVCGGVTEWRRISALASAYGVPVCPHAWHEVHAHLAASVPNAPYVEFFVDRNIVNTHTLFDREMTVAGGRLELPQAPGLGFGFREDVVERHAIGDWRRVT
jgi:L-alanine-DL-glutamate epimerase-like enolase superfamily enzyme